jgi:hypothetical protein
MVENKKKQSIDIILNQLMTSVKDMHKDVRENRDDINEVKIALAEVQGARAAIRFLLQLMLGALGVFAAYFGLTIGGK